MGYAKRFPEDVQSVTVKPPACYVPVEVTEHYSALLIEFDESGLSLLVQIDTDQDAAIESMVEWEDQFYILDHYRDLARGEARK